MEERRPISYSFEDIRRYRQGLMSNEEMHAFEKASMEDPFLADALEGYMQSDMTVAETHLANLSEKIAEKEGEKEKAVVVAMPAKRFAMLRVAAMVIVIAGAGLITYKLLDKKEVDTTPIAQVQEQKIPPAAQSNGNLVTDSTIPGKGDTKEAGTTLGLTTIESKDSNKFSFSAPNEKHQQKKKTIAGNVAKRNQQLASNATQVYDTNVTENAKDVSTVPTVNRQIAAAPMNNEIRGTIVTPSNEPLANTNLRLDKTKKEVKTDDSGNFVLNSKDTVVNAKVTSGYYANSSVQLRANSTSTINIGTIQLKADPNIKLDIEVIGLGSKKKNNNAKPEGGWLSFKEHIAKWLSNPADTSDWDNAQGQFEMEFYVDAKGFAKDVKVLNGLNSVVAGQIIEAIRQGPKWTSRNQKTRLLIRF